jgi:hypothetical protein
MLDLPTHVQTLRYTPPSFRGLASGMFKAHRITNVCVAARPISNFLSSLL